MDEFRFSRSFVGVYGGGSGRAFSVVGGGGRVLTIFENFVFPLAVAVGRRPAPFLSAVRVLWACTVGAVGGTDLRGWHGLCGLVRSGGLGVAAAAALLTSPAG